MRKARPKKAAYTQPRAAVPHQLHHGEDALAVAIARNDWERAALLVMLGFSLAARSLPDETIDDVLALLSAEEAQR